MLCRLLWSSRSLVLAVLTLSSSPWENSVLSTSTSISSWSESERSEQRVEPTLSMRILSLSVGQGAVGPALPPSNSSWRWRCLCSRSRDSSWYWLFLSDSSSFFMCALALLSRPSVVWRLQSGPRGIRSFNRSKHSLRWARLFFSSSLCVDLLWLLLNFLFRNFLCRW